MKVEQAVKRRVTKRGKLTQVKQGQELSGMSETGTKIVESCRIVKKP